MVIHAEEGRDCSVVLGVFRPADKAHKIAIVTLVWRMQSVFGYPNDEAYWHDPRGGAADRPWYGFYEVLSSTWPERLIAYNMPSRTLRLPTMRVTGTSSSAATMHPASSSPTTLR